MTATKSLPQKFRPFFWDYPFARLSIAKDSDLIIRRLLSSGSWDAIRWVRRTIGDRELRGWLVAHKGRGLSPRQLRFWEVIYDLPTRQVNSWIRASQNGVWEKR
jgi:hypothetical protein